MQVERIAFRCYIEGNTSVLLSPEHEDYRWISVADMQKQRLSISSFLEKTLATFVADTI